MVSILVNFYIYTIILGYGKTFLTNDRIFDKLEIPHLSHKGIFKCVKEMCLNLTAQHHFICLLKYFKYSENLS